MRLLASLHRLRIRAAGWIAGKALRASYSGGAVTRLLSDWVVGVLSPDTEIRGNLALMRARARDLVRNNAYMAGVRKVFEDNLIGPDGILLQAKVTVGAGKTARPHDATNWEIERAWKEWGYPENASIDTRASWVDGEVFLRGRPDARNAFQFAVQFIDPDQVDEFYNVPFKNGVEIRMGVEIDADGRPLAYHVNTTHPDTGKPDRERIDAREIKHLYIQVRPGQTRGVTWFAPILTSAKHIESYREAELVAARIQATQAGVIVAKGEDAIAAYAATTGKDGVPASIEMEPGVYQSLPPGYSIENSSPTHPNMNFGEFVKAVSMPMARALGISYLTLTGDVSAANYSSMRAGLIPERDHFRCLQNFIALHACRWVYREWVGQALLTQQLRVDTRIRSDLYAVEWKPRGWKWVDPANDLDALEAEIRLGLTTRTRAAAERGNDFEEVVDELKKEQEYAEAEGVDVSVERKSAQQDGGNLTERRQERDDRAVALVK